MCVVFGRSACGHLLGRPWEPGAAVLCYPRRTGQKAEALWVQDLAGSPSGTVSA